VDDERLRRQRRAEKEPGAHTRDRAALFPRIVLIPDEALEMDLCDEELAWGLLVPVGEVARAREERDRERLE
jgi:hypothetical protein